MSKREVKFLNPFRTAKFQQQGKVYDEAENREVYKPPARITMDEDKAKMLLTDEGFERFLNDMVIRPRDFKTNVLLYAASQESYNPHMSDAAKTLGWALAVLVGLKVFSKRQ